MKKFLAKSNPIETIQDHTDNLIRNYELLRMIYPNLEIDWDLLYLACLYHDFGKMNSKFQRRLTHGKKDKDEIPHGVLSLAFIDFGLLESKGYNYSEIKVLFHSIGYHHERDFKFDHDELDEEVNIMADEYNEFNYSRITKKFLNDYIEEGFFTINERIYEKESPIEFKKYIMLKGLLNKIDYAASGHTEVEVVNNFIEESMGNLLKVWKQSKPSSNWNDLQLYMIENQNSNVIVVGQTGMGKTEAGLLWIGNNKGFFTLPLKTAINSIYKRIISNIVTDEIQDKVGLLHSDTYSEYLNMDIKETDLDDYYNRTKQLSLPLTICTIDQIFDFVYRYRGFELKLATLSYSKVVIDEIQMYSPDLIAYLIIGLSYISEYGGKFAILTATLPQIIVDILKEEGVDFKMPLEPFIDNTYFRHRLKVIESGINAEYIKALYKENKVLVICNTVKKAQQIYKELCLMEIDSIDLLHSAFIKRDRKLKEDKILELGDSKSLKHGIWVSTQIVEASLDIDFDILITELSDVNGLLQRMGRCYRKRSLVTDDYNCHAFIGDKTKPSGIGHVIDQEIFELSRQYIKDYNGVLTEKEKINLVNSIYTTENLKNTKYYQLIINNINYVRSIDDFEKSKADIRHMFRNIQSATIIPIVVYNLNKEMIQSLVSIISSSYNKNMTDEERAELKRLKVIARNNLMGFTLNVRPDQEKGNIISSIALSKYEFISILDCNYTETIGLEMIKSDNENITKVDKIF